MPSGLLLALGVWLIVAAFLWRRGAVAGFDAAWNDFTIGTALAILATFRILGLSRRGAVPVLAVVAGCWLLVAPFVLGYQGGEATAATWNSCIVGVLVVGLATYSLSASRTRASA